MAVAHWSLAALLLLACRGENDEALSSQVAACATALEAAVAGPPADRVIMAVEGCAPACPGLAAWASERAADSGVPTTRDSSTPDGRAAPPGPDAITRFLSGCQLFCGEESERAWTAAALSQRFAVLAGQCGSERYGLPGPHADALSASWLATSQIARWLGQHGRTAGKSARAMLDRVGSTAYFVLPLPAAARNLYTLAEARYSRASDAGTFVILDGPRLRAGITPAARLRPGSLTIDGDAFPGQLLGDPARDHARLAAQASDRPATAGSAPLVLVDRGAPVSELIRAAAALGQSRILLAVSGYSARVHPIPLEMVGTSGTAAPLFAARSGEWVIVGGGEELHIAQDDAGRARLAHELLALSVRWAPQNKLELEYLPGASIADLLAMLDVVAESKYTVALLEASSSNPP